MRPGHARFVNLDRKPQKLQKLQKLQPVYLVAHPGSEMFGSDRMALESVRGFLESGARVIVALPSQGPLVPELIRAGASVVIVPMLVLRKALLRPSAWLNLVRDSLRGGAAAYRLLVRQRPNVVYVSTVTIPQWPLLARMRRIEVVSHIHEAEASGSRLVNGLLYGPHLCAQTVLVNSEFSKRTLARSLPTLSGRVRVLYNGVLGPAVPTPPRAQVDELRVLYVGRLSPRKGVDVVVDAATLMRERGSRVRVTVLGSAFPGYEWYETRLRESAAQPGSAEVDFLGFQSEIWPILADHDVLVVPSRIDEPFGNTAVEGILALRPVVASDTSGLREAAGGYSSARLVTPDAPSELADALEAVVSEWGDIAPRVEAAAQRARARHSPATYRKVVAEAVREVMRAR